MLQGNLGPINPIASYQMWLKEFSSNFCKVKKFLVPARAQLKTVWRSRQQKLDLYFVALRSGLDQRIVRMKTILRQKYEKGSINNITIDHVVYQNKNKSALTEKLKTVHHRYDWLRGQNPWSKKINATKQTTKTSKSHRNTPKSIKTFLKFQNKHPIIKFKNLQPKFQLEKSKNSKKNFDHSQTSYGRPGRVFNL